MNDDSGNNIDGNDAPNSSTNNDAPLRRVRIVRAGGRAVRPTEPAQQAPPAQPVRASEPRRTAYREPQRGRAPYPNRYPRNARSSSFDARPYIVGGVVTGLITLLLVVVWLLATPNGPFSSRPVVVPAPTISNGLNPFDVPTEVEPVGTGVPPAIPSNQPQQVAPTVTPSSQSLMRMEEVAWSIPNP